MVLRQRCWQHFPLDRKTDALSEETASSSFSCFQDSSDDIIFYVNRWLENNDNFIGRPPAELHIMSELNELKFNRNRQRHPAMPRQFIKKKRNLAMETLGPIQVLGLYTSIP
ncbi:hypothetical protein MSG28_010057 [Choristoneura fumiferana]|uniref:Uncharacterized protein n=1 Tax=Choristoneura fumiferana TaxID=7141 RepID=A0ACC0KJ80_CHOFU|nr:hypothetical protein MSG28_010057 [Choristoneura fumiferana]